jgi:MFS family permease
MRIGLALLPRPLPPQAVVRGGSILALIAAAVIWWQPGVAVTVTGFAVLGAALAGVFPALIALTPVRIGERRAQHVIAWQVGAAAAGGAGISALIGLLIGTSSLAILGPSITILAMLLLGAEMILTRLAVAAERSLAFMPPPGGGTPFTGPSAAAAHATPVPASRRVVTRPRRIAGRCRRPQDGWRAAVRPVSPFRSAATRRGTSSGCAAPPKT